MKAMRLTLNEHHRKLRAPIRDISDWLVNADASDFCRACRVLVMYTAREDKVTPRASLLPPDYLLPPTTPEKRPDLHIQL
jgi:hypothetical protein